MISSLVQSFLGAVAFTARCSTEPELLPLLNTGGGGTSFAAIVELRTVLYALRTHSRVLREATEINKRRIFVFWFVLVKRVKMWMVFAEESPR